MIKSKDYIVGFSTAIPGYYDVDELERLYDLTITLPQDSIIVEIGVEYGRSASIFLQLKKHWKELWLIDNRSHNAEEGRTSTWRLVERFGDDFGSGGGKIRVLEESSETAAINTKNDPPWIDLLHIDADHEQGVHLDCELWLPKLRIGGIVVFHDFERKGADPSTGSVFPEVDKAVYYYTGDTNKWQDLGTINTQAVRRKLA